MPDAVAYNFPTRRAHAPTRSVLLVPTQSTPDLATELSLTVVSARFRSWARLECRAHLRRPRPARIAQTTSRWRAKKRRKRDGSTAPTLRSRALETWRPQRCVTMSRLSARYAQLIRMCRRRGCSREDARDLVQEAHLRFFDYQRTAKVRDADSLLRRILINLSITHFHRERSPPFTFESAERLDRRGLLIDPAPGPERAAAAEQELGRVVGILSAVSPRTCQIFIAQRGGYSYEEIAAAFAVRPRTIEKHVTTAGLILTELMPESFATP
jgi:RNA polymerase sigma factor (sigma-70 family)